ncbi:ribonuclease H-like domain-containing protein [Paenibacillus sp. PAMC21692]|uniref:ribonuclease H-like domain-containing protein n=1 Tax=Paenibacillus sp. PAMC21692 TaxID=2762320 RepID=UPI00164D5F8B|nr:ribonuclease H-like domain-containing protein [Paenibacillus sp. PAMC21692]QNK55232.1 ribonuclease H-like domain-containing protein [Paenibacillus sp. PAMC21692]
MSMRERMNRLRASAASEASTATETVVPSSESECEPQEELHPGWASFGVTLRRSVKGDYLVRRTEFSLDYQHGTHQLGELIEAATGLSEFHAAQQPVEPESILYLDLETTGLGVGTGNVPFMTGFAFVQGNKFIIEQSLIRHPAEEYAMLYDLEQRLSNYRYLVTYNGKTFDWPLVQNRMIMNAMGRELKQPLHLDFLHPSRSIWRNTLASCKLSHIEEERLGIFRTEDVPGSLAPQLYFQFLADGDPAPLEGVFLHNELDLLALACLSIRFGHLLREDIFRRIPYPEETEELVRTGLWLEHMGKSELAEELFGRALLHEEPSPSALNKLAARDKKAGNWQRAVVLWQKVVHASGNSLSASGHDACIELSMYFEHRSKELHQSLHYCAEALARMQSVSGGRRLSDKETIALQDVRKRIQRIQSKIHKLELGALSK